MPGGRPSKYDAKFAKQASHLAQLGATDQEIADFFEVEARTIYRWKHDHDEFCHALKAGKDVADDRVERSLYQRAIGYEQDEVKIFMPGGADKPVYAPFRAKVAPDVTAAIFWLKNRRSDAWRDVKHIDSKQETTHRYDLDSLAEERLGELERILADAERSAGSEGERSLLKFTEFTNPLYERAGHHERIAARLEAVERGEIDRLMIFMPPRHGKSELASKRFPAWCLGRKPNRQIIAASYNSDLANDFGRNVRNLVAEPEFGQVFPNVTLAPDSQAAMRMNTNHGGAYVAAGVGTAVTGRGAHIALIDDPFKDREEADSERRRDLVWDWYRSTLYTRLMPGGSIVLIQTRWHEDDLAGRLLEQEPDQWEVLELPAIDREGKALWPEWYDEIALARIKATIGPREWLALYQQQPQPDEGTFFKREWFKEWTKLPTVRYYGTSDYAVTDGGGDYTVQRIWGIDSEGDVYRVDGWRGQTASDEWIERKLDLIAKYKPLCWFGEGGVIQKAIEPMLRRRMRERNVHCRLEWLPSVADKPTRARSIQAMAAAGRVHFEKGADLSEFLVFPAGKHDDEVDTASLIGRAIDQAHPAIVKNQPPAGPRDRWNRQPKEEINWKTV